MLLQNNSSGKVSLSDQTEIALHKQLLWATFGNIFVMAGGNQISSPIHTLKLQPFSFSPFISRQLLAMSPSGDETYFCFLFMQFLQMYRVRLR